MFREDVSLSTIACATNNLNQVTQKDPLRHQHMERLWSHLQINDIGPLLHTKRGNFYCLMVVDSFTKWVEAFPTQNCMVLMTARILIYHVFARWGLPKVINIEQGPRFVGQITKEVCHAFYVKQKLHVPGRPQCSEIVERIKWIVKTVLRKVVNTAGNN